MWLDGLQLLDTFDANGRVTNNERLQKLALNHPSLFIPLDLAVDSFEDLVYRLVADFARIYDEFVHTLLLNIFSILNKFPQSYGLIFGDYLLVQIQHILLKAHKLGQDNLLFVT